MWAPTAQRRVSWWSHARWSLASTLGIPSPRTSARNWHVEINFFSNQDAVTVWLDTNGSSEVAQFARVNAAGSIANGIYRASDDNKDSTPDLLDVEVATHRLKDVFSVELRWPLSVLPYPLHGNLPWQFKHRTSAAQQMPK